METIFADECGYTGTNLLDREQPVFVWATLKVSDTEARNLKDEFFSEFRGTELKHSLLGRRENHQRSVLAFLGHLSGRQDRLGFAYVHKEFALTAKMVDWIIEPSFHCLGHSIYEDGLNLAFSNLTYTVISSLGEGNLLRAILAAFSALARQPSTDLLAAYNATLHVKDAPKPLNQVLDFYRAPIQHLGGALVNLLDPSCLEIANSIALATMAQWSQESAGPFRLVQDEFSEMARNKATWDAIVHPSVAPLKVGRDRRTMEFPLRVNETILADSTQHAGLQLADVLAGAIARALRSLSSSDLNRDSYAQQVMNEIGDWVCSEHLWPSSDVTPEALETTGPSFADPIEHISEILRRADQG